MRWMISQDGGVTYSREVNHIGPSAFSYERDLGAGQIFFRHKLNTKLYFRTADFNYFLGIERTPSQRCMEIFIQRQWKCGGKWTPYWTGTFSVGAGDFNLDRCEFWVKPDVIDKYSCLLSKKSKKINILQAEPVTVNAVVIAPAEFMVCRGGLNVENYYSSGPCDEIGDDPEDPSPAYRWSFIDSFNYDFGDGSFFFGVSFYWRERQRLPCINNVATPPIGSGWLIYEDNCDQDGTSTWVRTPQFDYPFGIPTAGTLDDHGDPVPPDGSCQWIHVGTVSGLGGVNPTPFFVCMSSESEVSQTYTRARRVEDALQLLIAGCGLSSVKSDFFEWNAPGTAAGYVAGMNYVTGRRNQVDQLLFLQNTDALLPPPTNPATLGEWTFKGAMELMAGFEVFWDIEGSSLRLEHWTYWTTPIGLDLSADNYGEASLMQNAWKSLKEEVPRFERLTFTQSQGADFRGLDIEYEGPCVSSGDESQVEERVVPLISADVAFYYADPDAVSRQGFLLLATEFNGTDYSVLLDEGAVSLNNVTNAPVSTANLQRDFWLDRRFLRMGLLNGQPIEFRDIRPNIEQIPATVPNLCCELIRLDPKKRVKTELGQKLGGLPAHIQKLDFEERGETATVTLRYSL